MTELAPGRRAALDVNPRVTFAALGAAVAAILIFILEATLRIDLPTTVEGAISVVATFGAGYMIPVADGYQSAPPPPSVDG